MSGETILRLVGGAALLGSNAFFVMTEFALTRVRQLPRARFQGSRGLRVAWEMTERLEIYLSGCQVGITVSSIGLGVVAEPAVAAVLHPLAGTVPVGTTSTTVVAAVLAFMLINLLHVVFGEQAPTYLGVERTVEVARWCAIPHLWWTRATMPVIWLADRAAKAILGLFGVTMTRAWLGEGEEEDGPVATADLRRRMGELLARGDVPADRRLEVLNALEIGVRRIAEVMVPRERIVALRSDRPFEVALRLLSREGHGRYPLIDGALESYRGNVYAPALFGRLEDLQAGRTTLLDLAHPPMRLQADTSIADAIDRFQEETQELALVYEGDQVVGLLTSTDAMEAITGDLEDPLDRETRG